MQRLISVTDSDWRKSTSNSPTECKFETELCKRALALKKKTTIYSPLMKQPIIQHRTIISVCLKLEIFQKKNGLLSQALKYS